MLTLGRVRTRKCIPRSSPPGAPRPRCRLRRSPERRRTMPNPPSAAAATRWPCLVSIRATSNGRRASRSSYNSKSRSCPTSRDSPRSREAPKDPLRRPPIHSPRRTRRRRFTRRIARRRHGRRCRSLLARRPRGRLPAQARMRAMAAASERRVHSLRMGKTRMRIWRRQRRRQRILPSDFPLSTRTYRVCSVSAV